MPRNPILTSRASVASEPTPHPSTPPSVSTRNFCKCNKSLKDPVRGAGSAQVQIRSYRNRQSGNLARKVRNAFPGSMTLRPLTWGKRFLLFLPDSHSAYYDSFVSALGQSLPPSLGLSRICCTCPVSGGNGGWGGGGVGGGLTHPCLQHWVKWLWERVWDFLALGGPTSSVSRRVVKLTISHYYSAPLPLQKRGYGDETDEGQHH